MSINAIQFNVLSPLLQSREKYSIRLTAFKFVRQPRTTERRGEERREKKRGEVRSESQQKKRGQIMSGTK